MKLNTRLTVPQQVPACKAYTITWAPSSPNSVSLILLRGPSNNVVPLQNIVVGIANSGSYTWNVPANLEADTSRYGIQLIDDVTGFYQYSTQFGISKGAECNGYVAPSSSASPYNNGGYPVSTPPASSKPASTPLSSTKANSTTPVPVSTPIVISSTGYPAGNSSVIMPSKSMSVPSSLVSASRTGVASSTRSALPESTGAASSLKAGFSLVGAVAAMAFML